MSTESLLQTPNYEDSLYSRKVKGRSSLDTFIIPNRTRLPSSKPKVPEEFDFNLTKTLLDIEEMEKPTEAIPKTSSQRDVVPVAKRPFVPNTSLIHQRGSSGTYSWSPTGFDGPIDSTDQSRGTSTTWSTVSARISTDSSPGSDHRDTQNCQVTVRASVLEVGLRVGMVSHLQTTPTGKTPSPSRFAEPG